MLLNPRRVATALAVTAVTGGALLSSGVAVSHAAGAPPWEPTKSSVGGLKFFNKAGHEITSGSTSSSPFAAYVQGTATIRKGDTKATLYAYTPKKGADPGQWSGEALTASISYPNHSAKGKLKSSKLPLLTGKSGDESIGDYAVNFPNTSSASGYAKVYQLRLRTSAPGKTVTPKYDSADIEVTGSKWKVIYTKGGATATKVGLKVSATKVKVGTKVTLLAKVAPKAAKGKVKFLDGHKVLKTVAVVKGKAKLATKKIKVGKHKLTAAFVPKSSSYSASKSSTHKLTVTKKKH